MSIADTLTQTILEEHMAQGIEWILEAVEES